MKIVGDLLAFLHVLLATACRAAGPPYEQAKATYNYAVIHVVKFGFLFSIQGCTRCCRPRRDTIRRLLNVTLERRTKCEALAGQRKVQDSFLELQVRVEKALTPFPDLR